MKEAHNGSAAQQWPLPPKDLKMTYVATGIFYNTASAQYKSYEWVFEYKEKIITFQKYAIWLSCDSDMQSM